MQGQTAPSGESDQSILRARKAFGAKENNWNTLFDECFDYTMPGRTGFYDESPGQRRTAEIFDDTAVGGVQEFASRIQSGLTPGHVRWASFAPGHTVPADQKREMLQPLEDLSGLVFDILQQTNISAELHESYLDLSVGTGVMRIDQGNALELIRFRSVPMPYVALDEGPDGRIDGVFVKHFLEYNKIDKVFPDAKNLTEADAQNNKRCQLVESCYRDWSKTNEFVYTHCLHDMRTGKQLMKKTLKGIGSSPFIVFRWAKAAGEVWGRGPVINSLSSIKTVNLVSQLILENADLAVSGMWQVDDDGSINPDTIRIAPGAVIPVAPNTRGLQPLPSAGRFDLGGIVLEDLRTAIRRALFNEQMGSPNLSPKTATEIAERMADLSRRLAGTYSRLQNELVVPLMQRTIFILRQRGLVETPPINGVDIRVIASAPLSQAQRFQDIENFSRFMQLLGGLFGPQISNLMVDQAKATDYLADNLAVPQTLIRTPDEREALMQQLMATQNPQMGEQSEAPEQPGATIG